MLTKRMFFGAMIIIAITTLGEQVEAHYLRVSAGYTIWHSTKCDLVLKAVPNPDANPAQFECLVTVTLVDTLCQNPTNHNVNPGQAATQTSIVSTEQITPSDITDKKKGIASVDAVIPDGPLLNNEFCVNPNWNIVDVLIREATVQYNVWQCVDTSCVSRVLHTSSEFECTLPAQFNFSNPPLLETPYQCTENFSVHSK